MVGRNEELMHSVAKQVSETPFTANHGPEVTHFEPEGLEARDVRTQIGGRPTHSWPPRIDHMTVSRPASRRCPAGVRVSKKQTILSGRIAF